MTSFYCEHCGKMIGDSPDGYVTGCGHYPLGGVALQPRGVLQILNELEAVNLSSDSHDTATTDESRK